MKFGFLAKHRGTWPVSLMCEALDVSRSGFYAWFSRPRSQRSHDDEFLGSHVRQSFVGILDPQTALHHELPFNRVQSTFCRNREIHGSELNPKKSGGFETNGV